MEFRPKNKYLLVEQVEDKKPESQTSGFILPDDYKKVETHKLVRLLSVPSGSSYHDCLGCLVVVPTNMVEEIKVHGRAYYVVPEQGVYGVFYN